MSNEYIFVAMLSINDWEIPIAMPKNYLPQLNDKEVKELTKEEKDEIFRYVNGAMDAFIMFHPIIKNIDYWYGHLSEVDRAHFIVV